MSELTVNSLCIGVVHVLLMMTYSLWISIVQMHIIDFTGLTTQFFVNEKLDVTDGSPDQSGKDVSSVFMAFLS